MSLVEISIAIMLGLIVSIGGILFINSETQILRQQTILNSYTTTLPQVRGILSRTAAQATRTRVFTNATVARTSSDNATLTGSAARLEYASGRNTPAGSYWTATLEYRSGSRQIFYRNQDGVEWVAVSNLTSCSFSIVDGALLVQFVSRGRTGQVYVAVN